MRIPRPVATSRTFRRGAATAGAMTVVLVLSWLPTPQIDPSVAVSEHHVVVPDHGLPPRVAGPDVGFPFIASSYDTSGPSPFAGTGCGDNTYEGPAVDGYEREPHLAVNPNDPEQLVLTWQQDRHTLGGGSRAVMTAASRDGGRSWTTPVAVPGISACADGERLRATLPRVALGPDGVAYSAAVAMDARTGVTDAGPEWEWDADIVLNASPDGGATWPVARTVIARDDGTWTYDIPRIAADPSRAGHAVAVWTRSLSPEHATFQDFLLQDGRLFLSKTTDAGATWTEPVEVPAGARSLQVLPVAIQFVDDIAGPPGLVLVYLEYAQRFTFEKMASVQVIRSSDGGQSWTRPSQAALIESTLGPPSFAVGPSGEFFLAWLWEEYVRRDGMLVPQQTLTFARSDDQGLSWSARNALQALHPVNRPQLGVTTEGAVGFYWLDFPTLEYVAGGIRGPLEGPSPVEIMFQQTVDGGATWRMIRLAGPVEYPDVTMGNYFGMVGLIGGYGAAYVVGEPEDVDGPVEIRFSKISAGDQAPAGARVTATGIVPGKSSGDARVDLRVEAVGYGELRSFLEFEDLEAKVKVNATHFERLTLHHAQDGLRCHIAGTASVTDAAGRESLETLIVQCLEGGQGTGPGFVKVTTESYEGGGTLRSGKVTIS